VAFERSLMKVEVDALPTSLARRARPIVVYKCLQPDDDELSACGHVQHGRVVQLDTSPWGAPVHHHESKPFAEIREARVADPLVPVLGLPSGASDITVGLLRQL